ncbi:MAG TPA: formate--phosphoribosylaminoimidazolecarboxamide ligase family protein [Euryarchaeota archaeon]|nr:MAG: 5-formaminoimidazole-4-carboxamide-1-(beta)-D-ribofuranosyl 5'-monophosphate synthetase [Thermoplasmatales archaeon ex4484_6]RLF68034.1 MAG: 5-formaminoimidazole-4-carboxamide-1-(beta)-D-ribofuranosyl 5'-monophosphate synthetase [Thermoplasmata archaeon]HHD15226.1 formate--phosphoribosylaminoimidazolecarboxamide ligase family protein [Euryarchaeota archaeon]
MVPYNGVASGGPSVIDRSRIQDLAGRYDTKNAKIGVVASHSALDTCDGAVEEGFRTVAFCQKGRERTYARYFRAQRSPDGRLLRGMVDEPIVLDRFREVMDERWQSWMRNNSVVWVPNRSFTSYVDITAIENEFEVPMFGSRNMLRSEEREEQQSYYWLLEKAGLPFPERIEDPDRIDELSIVKLHHKQKKLERGFFTCSSPEEFGEKSEKLIAQGVIDRETLDTARIERYVIGPVFNFDFFYSPLEEEMSPLELLGVDWRFETSLDGHVRLPAPQQMSLNEEQILPEYTVCGHNSATLRESLLEKVFAMAEKFVDASKRHYDPGIIGPFCLQTCVDKDLNFYIYDVAPRIGGGTNVHMWVGHPYGNSLWRKPVSTGRRLAMEVRRALEEERLDEIVT